MEIQPGKNLIHMIAVEPFHMEHPHCGIIHTRKELFAVNTLVTPKGRLREKLDTDGKRMSYYVQKSEQISVLRAWLQDIQLVRDPWMSPEPPAIGYILLDAYRRSFLLARLVEPKLFAALQQEKIKPWLDCRSESKRIQNEALSLAKETDLYYCMEEVWYRKGERLENPPFTLD